MRFAKILGLQFLSWCCILTWVRTEAATLQTQQQGRTDAKQSVTTAAPASNELVSMASANSPPQDKDIGQINPFRRQGGSVSVMKTHAVIYKNVDGEKEQYEQRREEVHKNGKVIARVQQELDKTSHNNEPYVKTMLDIPSKNLHRIIEHGPKSQIVKETIESKSHSHGVVKARTIDSKPFSPLDMAEYVFWTGDERGASSAIEEFLEDGLMSRDEAIVFLEEIKQNLESLKRQYAGDPERPMLQLVQQKHRFY